MSSTAQLGDVALYGGQDCARPAIASDFFSKITRAGFNSSFIETSYDWGTIKKNAGRAVCLSGEDDPYVPARQGEELAAKLGVKNHIIPRGGHLNAEFGYTSFPEILALLNQAAM